MPGARGTQGCLALPPAPAPSRAYRVSPPTPAWGPEVLRPLSPPLERSNGWDLRPRSPSTTLLPTCPVQVRVPSAPLRGSSCARSARRRGRESAAPAPEFWIPGSPSPMPSASFLSFPRLQGPSTPEAGPGQGVRARARAGFARAGARPAAALGGSGDWSEDWGGYWPRERVLSLRPTQCSSFRSRPGLRWRVRWGKDWSAEPEWGKGPARGRGCALSLTLPNLLGWTVPKLWRLLPQKDKDPWEVERRGQRGRLPLGLCAATCLGPLGGGLATQHSTFLEGAEGVGGRTVGRTRTSVPKTALQPLPESASPAPPEEEPPVLPPRHL